MILNEKDYLGGLMQWTGNQMGAAKDKAMMAVGSDQAVGRLNIRATTEKLIKSWKAFCGERQKAGVQGYDAYDPTMSQIEEFLKKRFNIDMNLSDDPEIADAAEEAGVQEGDPTDLKATSRKELESLKRMATGDNVRAAGKPGPAKARSSGDSALDDQKAALRTGMKSQVEKDRAAGLPTRESVELSEAGQGDALRRLFGTIALHMWDNGLVKVNRGTSKNNKTTHSVSGVEKTKADGESNDDDESTDISTRVDANGNYLNAEQLREGLRKKKIDGRTIHLLKAVVKSNPVSDIYRKATPEQQKLMVNIAAVTVASVDKTESVMRAGENVTSDGNTLNFNAFTEALKKNRVDANAFTKARRQLTRASADGVIDEKDVETLMGSSEELALSIIGIVAAMVISIETVGQQKPDAEKPEAKPEAKPEEPEQKAPTE